MSWCRSFIVIAAALSIGAAHAADIGGWIEQKRRAELEQTDDCVQIIGLAAKTARRDAATSTSTSTSTPEQKAAAADSYYASGLCYLVSSKVARDDVAAAAWLERAARLDHPLARRALLSLREPAATTHPAGQHCHDLGSGRKVCHGGPSRQSENQGDARP